MLDECHRAVEWIVHTQREDGSWGYFDQGTLEETAYALTALLHCHGRFPIDDRLLHKGAAYLVRQMVEGYDNYLYPPLWIGKSLFVPRDIVRASILAALKLYKETFD
jgi:halimadienyl-diphosphate synthase